MEIPHKVEIKPGIFYTVAYVSKFDDPNQLGACNDKAEKSSCRSILIKTGMTEQKTKETFVHELLHAIEFEYKLKIPHALIYALEGPLLKVLLMNPHAFAPYLMGAASKRKKPIRKKRKA